jgi:phasin
MAETTVKTDAAVKTKTAKTTASFDTSFDPARLVPQFDMPKVEVPAAFRELAEKGVSQAKDAYERMKTTAEETTVMLEDTFTSTAKGSADYGLKVIEAARANANAAFDFVRDVIAAKSPSEFVELSTGHARKQFDALSSQSRELTALAQKVALEATEPVRSGVAKVFGKVS